MKSSRGVWGWAAAFALLVSMGFSWRMLLCARFAGDPAGRAGSGQGLLAAISLQAGLLHFGFRNVLADVAWLEAVQVAGNIKMAPADYDRLYDLLNIEANFDPKFDIPYLLGGLVLGESPDHAQKALRGFRTGKEAIPRRLEIPLLHRIHELFFAR